MTSRHGSLVRLLAGTSADERRPATSPGPEREWHLPAHVRDPKAVRERMIAQVAAGADVLLAHTFLTHRRALARVGEARRGREPTLSAVVLARQAAEQGRDGLDQATAWSTVPVLVAGALPLLGEDPGSGRLGPVDGAVARDLHDHAGLLADAGVDVIVIEGPRSLAETAVAVSAARSVGIETWAVVDRDALVTSLDELGGPKLIIVTSTASLADADPLRAAVSQWERAHGTMVDALLSATDPAPVLRGVLASGAVVLGIADGATPERIAIVRAAIEAHGLERAGVDEARGAEWLAWVAQGAARAPTGPALWLSTETPRDLPAGWEWMVLEPGRVRQIPDERYRLIVSDGSEVDATHIERGLELGGVGVFASPEKARMPEALRTLERRRAGDGTTAWFICRREAR